LVKYCDASQSSCFSHAGKFHKDFGQTVIGRATMGFRQETKVQFNQALTSSQREQCLNQLATNQRQSNNGEGTTNTKAGSKIETPCETESLGSGKKMKTSWEYRFGSMNQCCTDCNGGNNPLPIDSSMISISTLPLAVIDGIETAANELQLRAVMDHFMGDAWNRIHDCTISKCGDHGNCYGYWSGNSIAVSSHCRCTPPYVSSGSGCVPPHKPHAHAPHGHNPHRHNPHAHAPHGHNPHVHNPHRHSSKGKRWRL